MDAELPALPIGHAGRLEAVGLTNAAGSHAVLLRQDDAPRVLLTAEPTDATRERVVVVPLDSDVELRVDGDALAIWLAEGSVGRAATGRVPAWASAIGFVGVLLVLAFVVVGAATVFGWLLGLLGWLS